MHLKFENSNTEVADERQPTRFRWRALAISASMLAVSSCTSTHAHWSARQLRQEAANYYEDQIMDNLIRASNGQMFVHVDLAGMNAVVSTKLAGDLSVGETVVDTTTVAGAAITVARAVTQPFTFLLKPDRGDSLTVNTDPIKGKPEVYAPYIRFLNLKDSKDKLSDVETTELNLNDPIYSLRVQPSGGKLAPGAYVPGTLTRKNGRRYYVPSEYRQAYFDLCLALLNRPVGKTSSATKGMLESHQESVNDQLLRTEEQLKKTEDKIDELRALELQRR